MTLFSSVIIDISSPSSLQHLDGSEDALERFTREYRGGFELCNGKLLRYNLAGGYFGSDGVYYSNITDFQGNIVAVTSADTTGSFNIHQLNAYYPDGMPIAQEALLQGGYKPVVKLSDDNRYKFGSKELTTLLGADFYDFEARMRPAAMPAFTSIDSKATNYQDLSPYNFCAGDPVNNIDPSGEKWEVIRDDNKEAVGYKWVPSLFAYDKNGELKKGVYTQAIFFSNEGKNGRMFDPECKYNIGSSIATVFQADGTVKTFNACTKPSDTHEFPTIPGGVYEAKVGKHKDDYPALRVGDVGTSNFYANTIELGFENPAYKDIDKRTYATGINIHKAGRGNATGQGNNGLYVSEGCLLIDRYNWEAFMDIFDQLDLKGSVVSVTVSRTKSAPIIIDELY